MFSLRKISEYFATKFYQGSLYRNPFVQAERVAARLFLAVVAAVSASVLLFCLEAFMRIQVIIGLPLLEMPLLPLLAPILIALYYVLKAQVCIRRRIEGTERELPFAAAYMTVAAAAGIPPTASFENLGRFKTLKCFAEEALKVKRLRALYSLNPVDALSFEAERHPSRRVREYLLAAAAAQRSGGEVYSALREKMQGLFRELEARMNMLSEKFSLLTSAEITIYVLVPMCLISIGAVFGGALGLSTLIAAGFILPAIFTAPLMLLVDAYMPKELTAEIPKRPMIASAVVTIVLIFSALQVAAVHYALALGLIGGGIYPAMYYLRKRQRFKEILEALPHFMRDIAEEVKKGEPPSQAICKLVKYRKYNPYFDGILKECTARLHAGRSLKDSMADIEGAPWMCKVLFELLDEAERVGVDPRCIDELTAFVNNMYNSFRTLRARTRFFKFGSYLSVAMLVLSLVVTIEL
ncbi:MAG TPA: hypothetical protein ENF82_04385, partial [Candidatus Methanomethylia archaeon]|nr:hypothetical protein [Candidatus Methanomethylicia archaeon]